MELTVVPLTHDNLYQVCQVSIEMERAYFSPGSVAYCLLANGMPVLAGGVVNMLWDRGEAWLLTTRFFRTHIKSSFGVMKRIMSKMSTEGGFRRIQATCATSMSITLFEHLGFYYEGTMNCFGPNGETCFMYARIFD